jgi:pimeloyl-ACP methyl ester carboxylesterase
MEVILVHGLWYGPWVMGFLGRHLQHAGFTVRQFAYRATASPVAEHASQLALFAERTRATKVHFVGHSLGGLVIVHMLAHGQGRATGRAVLLGTPLQGSRVARKVVRLPGGGLLLGQAADDLGRGQPVQADGHEIGMIAGCKALGLGRLLGQPDKASDGTIELDETNAPGLSGRVILPVSHTGMLYSSEVASQVANFLRDGRFAPLEANREQ